MKKNVWIVYVAAMLFISAAQASSEAELLDSFNEVAKSLPVSTPIKPTPIKPKPAPVIDAKNVKTPPDNAEIKKQLASAEQQLTALRASQKKAESELAEYKRNPPKSVSDANVLAQLTAQNESRNKELSQLRDQLTKQKETINQKDQLIAQLQLASAPVKSIVEKNAAPIPQGDTERDSYTLGQFFASNSASMLKILAAADVKVSADQLAEGFAARIQQHPSAIMEGEMANRYGEMQQSMQKGMRALVDQSQQKITQQIGKRALLKKQNGVSWLAVRSGKNTLVADQMVAVRVKVMTLEGKVINDFSDQGVPFNRTIPPLMYEGMALSGKGGAIEGWALAKDISNREPLPAWVAPYDVVHYQLALK